MKKYSADKDIVYEILCCLAWNLPLGPWKAIELNANRSLRIRIEDEDEDEDEFKDDCSANTVNSFSKYYFPETFDCWMGILLICCPCAKVIDASVPPSSEQQVERMKMLKENFELSKQNIKRIDMKVQSIVSTYYPFNKISLLFQREMGMLYIKHTLIENLSRCDRVQAMCDFLIQQRPQLHPACQSGYSYGLNVHPKNRPAQRVSLQ